MELMGGVRIVIEHFTYEDFDDALCNSTNRVSDIECIVKVSRIF